MWKQRKKKKPCLDDSADDPYLRCREYFLYLLSRRAYSQWELEQKAHQKGYASEVYQAVLNPLIEMGLVDDVEFAEQWVASRLRSKPRGKPLLRQELKQKGIEAAIIERVLDDAFLDIDLVELAAAEAKKQIRKYQHVDLPTQKRRLYGFLMRRGFSYEVVARVLDMFFS